MTPRAATPRPVGQRRYLTVMFADLVGSTALSEELDAEDVRELVLAYQTIAAAAIEENAGFLAHYMGDGILAYFGYPEAHEDDARLAVTAAMAIVAGIPALRQRFDRDDIDIRVGIHSGEVVVSDMGAGERRQTDDVTGETPNVAARLQSHAAPGTVVISDTTSDLVEGWFVLESLGDLRLKGLSRPVPGYRVGTSTAMVSRLETAEIAELTPLVGRDNEMQILLNAWQDVSNGAGRVVVLSGEAGIGKSRLVRELHDRIAHQASTSVRLYCSPHRGNSALFPLIQHLNRVVGDGSDGQRLDRLETLLGEARLPIDATAPLIADLLSIPWEDRWPPLTDSPERRKRVTLDAVHAWLVAGAGHAPVLLVAEDVQWTDPTTGDLFAPFFEQDSIGRVLVVVTHRLDHVPPWPDRPQVQRLPLGRLDPWEVSEIVGAVARGKALPPSVAAQISSRTDGVPLFVEELTQAVLESGAVVEGEDSWSLNAELPERFVPATLRESLMARLDRLGPARELAQLMATIGREVEDELLRAVTPLDDARLVEHLERLISADLVHRRRVFNRVTYSFKHWMVQDIAYESLLRSTRQWYHERIAETITNEFPQLADTQPEMVAHHLIAAARASDAVAYLRRAGELAARRSANVEAIGHLTLAIELVRAQPESPERDQRELSLLIALGAPLTASKGYSVPEVEETYSRAGELCRSLGGETPQFFHALYGTWRVHLLRADYHRALAFGEHLLRLAESSRDATQLAAAHRAVGSTLFYLGDDPTAARTHLGYVIAAGSADLKDQWLEELQDVVDPWVTCHAYEAWQLWLLGDREAAERLSREAQAIAQALEHPFTIALSICFDSWLRQFVGDAETVQREAEQALVLATEQGFAFWIGWARIMWGWAEHRLGDSDAGIAAMQAGLVEWRAVGSELGSPYFLALLAEALAEHGRVADALAMLDEADEVTERTGEGFWRPELQRLRGELLAREGAPREVVESWLRQAVETATRQGDGPLAARARESLEVHGHATASGAY